MDWTKTPPEALSLIHILIDTVLAQSSQNFVGGTSEQNQNAGNHAEHVEHWNLESDAKAMMTKLGITNFEQKAGELAGGQRKRLALVAALLVPCDVLILDEPTNHLDSAMADWLEDFLKKWRGADVYKRQAIIRSKAGIKDPSKPIGSFLFLGPTGCLLYTSRCV